MINLQKLFRNGFCASLTMSKLSIRTHYSLGMFLMKCQLQLIPHYQQHLKESIRRQQGVMSIIGQRNVIILRFNVQKLVYILKRLDIRLYETALKSCMEYTCIIDILDKYGLLCENTSSIFRHFSREDISTFLENFPVPTSFLLFIWDTIYRNEQSEEDKSTCEDNYREYNTQWDQLSSDVKNVCNAY